MSSRFDDLVVSCVKANAEMGTAMVELLVVRDDLQARLDRIVQYVQTGEIMTATGGEAIGNHILKLARGET